MLSNITIRNATEQDINELYEITCSVHLSGAYRALIPPSEYSRFTVAYSPTEQKRSRFNNKVLKRLESRSWKITVAMVDGRIAGFHTVNYAGDILMLKGLFVREQYQGKGIGKTLFESSIAEAATYNHIELEVISNNHRAIGLYKKQGFNSVGISVNTYYGSELLRMEKLLT
jgi:ribosomal protein S18 acetylase RimI-like enzyme